MLRWFSIAAVLLAALASPRPAFASDQQLPDSVRPGLTVSVVDEAGTVTHGRVDSVSDDVIRIKRRRGLEEVPLTRIVRIEKSDSLRNGALTGVVIGGTAGFFSAIAVMHGERSRVVIGMTLGNAVIYGALGTAIDAMIQGKRSLYERGRTRETRVAPIVGPRTGGAAVRVSW